MRELKKVLKKVGRKDKEYQYDNYTKGLSSILQRGYGVERETRVPDLSFRSLGEEMKKVGFFDKLLKLRRFSSDFLQAFLTFFNHTPYMV